MEFGWPLPGKHNDRSDPNSSIPSRREDAMTTERIARECYQPIAGPWQVARCRR